MAKSADPASPLAAPARGNAPLPFPVIAIGASAGGLEALSIMLTKLPVSIKAALVVVTHLPANKTSHLPEVLANVTDLPVVNIEDGMPVQCGTVYCAPAGHDLGIENGCLQLLEAGHDLQYRIIDRFLDELVRDQGSGAACVILSGAGSDGAGGALRLSQKGGLVLVQNPDTALHASMPQSVISVGAADAVLSPEELAMRITSWTSAESSLPPEDSIRVQRILDTLHKHTGHDLSGYRSSTINRRITKRRLLTGHSDLEGYQTEIENNPEERDQLFKSLFIGVTAFFRDPEAFDLLEKMVLPGILADRPEDAPLRIWIAGCSSGEEAYSIAMLFESYLGQAGHNAGLKIFATDIDDEAVDIARRGVYSPRDVENMAVPKAVCGTGP